MEIQPARNFRFVIFLAAILFSLPVLLPGQTTGQGSALSPEEVAKRLQFLKATGANVAPQPTPPPSAAALLKKRFSETRGVGIRLEERPSSTADSPKKPEESAPAGTGAKASRLVDSHAAEPPARAIPPSDGKVPASHHTTTPAAANVAQAHPSESHAKGTPAGETKAPHASSPSPSSIAEAHATESHTHGKATGETKAVHPIPAGSSSSKLAETVHHPDATPQHSPAPHGENLASVKRTAESRSAELHTTTPSLKPAVTRIETASAKQLLEMRIVDTHPMDIPRPTTNHPDFAGGRYPWKTSIVTTVFWVGEPPGGNNFTPNCSSSWDANWTRSYGGYDNPSPEARRNFLPVNFTPRQNPFYVALPYNDVTRGTTKPEARVVIPWFREAFRKEGQSVCRDRWIAVRNRAGRIAYAQWSDCGPFRTDHWQYVFGMDRPKPNLNGGAGLDVSPAMRDYLGLQSTDVTDWKFVDLKDVPNGPWLLYGDNNPFVQRRYRPTNAAASPGGPTSLEVAAVRGRSF
ncbi:MAG TPA: hypothetical protein VGM54_17840 [Chthoniobacter sp.]|jgi:hypothetical protein